MSFRMQKINELLKHEISEIILKEFDFSRDTMVTIIKVDTSSDLQQAKIKISVMPFLRAGKILKVLNSQAFAIKKLLGKKLKIKIIPKIQFQLDSSEEKVSRIEHLLKKTKQ